MNTHNPSLLAAAGLLLTTACGGGGNRGGGDGTCATPALPGDVVISEIFGDPPGDDATFEWFEIYNPTDAEIDLTGGLIRWNKADGSGEKGHIINGLRIAADSYVVAGDLLNDPAVLPEHVDYGYGEAISFANAEGEIAILCGGEEIDTVLYEEVSPNASRGFDGNRKPDAAGNDDVSAWCDGRTQYAEGVFGTPGAVNDACFGSAPTNCEEGGVERPTVPPMPGDIIISEVMPDTKLVGDDVGEWLELYVVRDVDLNGIAIGKMGEEPVDAVGAVECLSAPAGTHVLFAASDDPAINGGLPAPDFLLTLGLSNSASPTTTPSIELSWGGMTLDVITWQGTRGGKALSLDPDFFVPELNDAEAAFCDAELEYGDGDFGTPGSLNPHCLMPGECLEGDTPRPAVAPRPGDVVITEFLAQPDAVGAAEGEWFEVRANASFDLNGFEIGEEGEVEDTVEIDACVPVAAGNILVFARNPEPSTNGGLPDVAGRFGLALSNADEFFVGHGGQVLDQVAWSASARGIATALDGDLSDPQANDDEGNWCEATMPYGDGDLGTPGAPNPSCGGSPAGMCLDGGNLRAIVAPTEGDLVITEFMANPMAVDDSDGEFIEVLVTADVDLNGLQLGRDPGSPDDELPAGGDCIAVSAGDRVVFARSDDAGVNGGIAGVLGVLTFNIGNSDGSLFIGVGDETLDELTYTATADGGSTAVMPGSETVAGNDDELNFCTSGPVYGNGDRGTPGAANVCE